MTSNVVRYLATGAFAFLLSVASAATAPVFPLPSGAGSATCSYTSDGCFDLPIDFTVLIDETGQGVSISRQFEFTFTPVDGAAIYESTIVPSNGFMGTFEFGQVDTTVGPGDLVLIPATVVVLGSSPQVLQFLSGILYGITVAGTFATGGGNYDIALSAVPIPPALLLFGSALVSLGYLTRRRRQSTGPRLPA